MATVAEKAPQHLKCIKCDDVFNNPVTLLCGHTFCADCAGGDSKAMLCHVCGKRIAQSPKSAVFIKRLADGYKSVDTGGENICGACPDDEENKTAIVWCASCGFALCMHCEKIHSKLHTLHTTSNISEPGLKLIRPKCQKHPGFIIDQFCEDCEEVVCPKCCMENHRACKSVHEIEESVPTIDLVLKEDAENLEKNVPVIKSRISKCEEMRGQLDAKITVVENDIDEAAQKFVTKIGNQQKQLKQKLHEEKDKTLSNLENEVQSGELRIQDAQQRAGFVDEAKNSPAGMDHYEVYKMFRTLKEWDSKYPENIARKDYGANVRFQLNDNMLQSLDTWKIGDLEDENVNETRNLQIIDTGETGIRGITVLSSKGKTVIAVINGKGNSVRFYDAKKDVKLEKELPLESPAFDVTQLEKDKAGMTLPRKNAILIFRVGFEPTFKPVLEKRIKTRSQYCRLACLGTSPIKLAVTTAKSGCIEIIDGSGKKFASVPLELSSNVNLCYNKRLWVSDIEKQSICSYPLRKDGVVAKIQCHEVGKQDVTRPHGLWDQRVPVCRGQRQ